MHPEDRVEWLRGIWLFEQCSRDELLALARITTPVNVVAGRVLAREGDVGLEFVVVVDGEAAVTIRGENIAQVRPGSFFGELALLDPGVRTATVTAESPMSILVLNRPEFQALVDGSVPSVASKMLQVLAKRLRMADERLGKVGEPIFETWGGRMGSTPLLPAREWSGQSLPDNMTPR